MCLMDSITEYGVIRLLLKSSGPWITKVYLFSILVIKSNTILVGTQINSAKLSNVAI